MAERICSIEGCDRKHYGRGLCRSHYDRWRATGDPGPADFRVYAKGSLEERFWSKVDRRGPDECWEWLGARRAQNGYGHFRLSVAEGRIDAHIFAYEVLVGPVPRFTEGRLVGRRMPLDHVVCDNPPCCNPAHLRPGTVWENVRRSQSTWAKRWRGET